MNKCIHKLDLHFVQAGQSCFVDYYAISKFVTFGFQGDRLMAWFEFEPENPTPAQYCFNVYATGQTIPNAERQKFVQTVFHPCGEVYHIYEVFREEL